MTRYLRDKIEGHWVTDYWDHTKAYAEAGVVEKVWHESCENPGALFWQLILRGDGETKAAWWHLREGF